MILLDIHWTPRESRRHQPLEMCAPESSLGGKSCFRNPELGRGGCPKPESWRANPGKRSGSPRLGVPGCCSCYLLWERLGCRGAHYRPLLSSSGLTLLPPPASHNGWRMWSRPFGGPWEPFTAVRKEFLVFSSCLEDYVGHSSSWTGNELKCPRDSGWLRSSGCFIL